MEIMMEENPPLPEEMPNPDDPQPTKKIKAVAQEQFKVGKEKVEDVLVEAPKMIPEKEEKPKDLKKNELFDDYEKIYEEKKDK